MADNMNLDDARRISVRGTSNVPLHPNPNRAVSVVLSEVSGKPRVFVTLFNSRGKYVGSTSFPADDTVLPKNLDITVQIGDKTTSVRRTMTTYRKSASLQKKEKEKEKLRYKVSGTANARKFRAERPDLLPTPPRRPRSARTADQLMADASARSAVPLAPFPDPPDNRFDEIIEGEDPISATAWMLRSVNQSQDPVFYNHFDSPWRVWRRQARSFLLQFLSHTDVNELVCR